MALANSHTDEIDRLALAKKLYDRLGFRLVDVPWIIDRKYSMVTCPDEKYLMPTVSGDLVGSAEQAFVQLDHRGQLGLGRFMAITPCFRNEADDEWHRPYFMKLELYSNIDDTPDYLIQSATSTLMAMLGGYSADLSIEQTDEGQDILLDGIELGSYGVREFDGLKWAYGTGLAEPRFSQAFRRLSRGGV